MKTYFAMGVATLCAAAGSASALPTFLVTYGDTLYVRTGATQTSTTLSDDITSLAFAPDGTLYGTSRSDNDSDGSYELYEINDPLGTPSLTLVGDFLADNTTTIGFIGNQMYGIQKTPNTQMTSPPFLVSIDTGGLSQSPFGATGEISGPFPVGGSSYDPVNDTIWGVEQANPSMLWSIDRNNAPDPAGAAVGDLGIIAGNNGAEFWNGKLFSALWNFQTENLFLGRIDTGTGDFTQIGIVDNVPQGGSVGLAIIPTPGTLALLGLAGAFATRRRR